MRSAERRAMRTTPALLALSAALALAGCGSIGFRKSDAPAPASAGAAAPVASTSAAASAVVVPKAASTGPIAPATQRAYDDALALMRAGHPADAERGFRALTQSEPDLAGPHANLGVDRAQRRPRGRRRQGAREGHHARTRAWPSRGTSWASRIARTATSRRPGTPTSTRSPSTRTTPARCSTLACSTTCTWATVRTRWSSTRATSR